MDIDNWSTVTNILSSQEAQTDEVRLFVDGNTRQVDILPSEADDQSLVSKANLNISTHRYQYYCSPNLIDSSSQNIDINSTNHYLEISDQGMSMNISFLHIKPVLKVSKIPYKLSVYFRIHNKTYAHTWVSDQPNDYYTIPFHSNLAPYLSVLSCEIIKSFYILSKDKLITRTFTFPDQLERVLQNHNNFHNTDYKLDDIEIYIS